jgi:hypothetical protein
VDARKLSTGMHVVYMISMWLSTEPFVSRMYVSETVVDHVGQVYYTDGADSAPISCFATPPLRYSVYLLYSVYLRL